MKRSEINSAIDSAITFFNKMNFPLPPFAFFSPKEWEHKHVDYQEVIDCKLGWDVTDFGNGNFSKMGRTIFTLRNGNYVMKEKYPKSYAQKVMFFLEDQKSPIHYHKSKMEDIINQGGGIIEVRVWHDEKDIETSAGEINLLNPGESITLLPGTPHQFWAKKGSGPVCSMEISGVNDDQNDNYWLGDENRFPKILEDSPRRFILCSEYSF